MSIELSYSKNITIANYHGYRVTRSRMPYSGGSALPLTGIHFGNVHVNAESGFATCDENGWGTYLRVSKYPYENALEDVTRHRQIREREFAVLDIDDKTSPARDLWPSTTAKQLETGFFSIAGAAADANGKLYFVDRHQQRIYGWSEAEGLTLERDSRHETQLGSAPGSRTLIQIQSARIPATPPGPWPIYDG